MKTKHMFDAHTHHRKSRSTGGSALVVLLSYVVIGVTLITVAVALGISNALTTMQEEEGNHALEVAESGAENALLRLLRTPGYTGETLTVADGNATVIVNGTTTKTITSTGLVGTFSRTVQVVADLDDGVLSLISWREL